MPNPRRNRFSGRGPVASAAARHRDATEATAIQLRRWFNDAEIVQKAKEVKLVRDTHPAQPLANEPFCTRSQLLAYFDENGNEIARAHQYLRTDGSLGLSGKPDPKEVVHEGVLYFIP